MLLSRPALRRVLMIIGPSVVLFTSCARRAPPNGAPALSPRQTELKELMEQWSISGDVLRRKLLPEAAYFTDADKENLAKWYLLRPAGDVSVKDALPHVTYLLTPGSRECLRWLLLSNLSSKDSRVRATCLECLPAVDVRGALDASLVLMRDADATVSATAADVLSEYCPSPLLWAALQQYYRETRARPDTCFTLEPCGIQKTWEESRKLWAEAHLGPVWARRLDWHGWNVFETVPPVKPEEPPDPAE